MLIVLTVRVILFGLVWGVTFGKHHLWIFPNLTEDVGIIESFLPLYQHDVKTSTSDDTKVEDEKSDDAIAAAAENSEEASNAQDNNSQDKQASDEAAADVTAPGAESDDKHSDEAENSSASKNSQDEEYEIVQCDEVKDASDA